MHADGRVVTARIAPALRARAAPIVAGVAALLLAATATVIAHRSGRGSADAFAWPYIGYRVAGFTCIIGGATAWWRGSRPPLARLGLAFGAALFVRDLRESDDEFIRSAGVCLAYGWTGIAAQITLAWPSGQVRGAGPRCLLGLGYFGAVGSQVMRIIDPDHGARWADVGSWWAGIVSFAVAVVIINRWRQAITVERSADPLLLGFVIIAAVTALVAFVNANGDATSDLDVLPIIVSLAVLPVAAVAYGRLLSQLHQLRAAREETLVVLEEVTLSRRRVAEAAFAERHRIQRDLHDGAQQGLAALQLRLSETQRALQAGSNGDVALARQHLDQARTQLGEAVERLRDLVQAIYPAVLRDYGLLVALEEIARQLPLPLILDIAETRWADELEVTAYLCAMEAITNALRHADATRIAVTIEETPDAVLLGVVDDGRGEALPPDKGGLSMLKDRVETFGGTVHHFTSVRGAGTRIILRLPKES